MEAAIRAGRAGLATRADLDNLETRMESGIAALRVTPAAPECGLFATVLQKSAAAGHGAVESPGAPHRIDRDGSVTSRLWGALDGAVET